MRFFSKLPEFGNNIFFLLISQKRITENIISELEEKINTLLEKLALMQTEFDFNKTEASDQIRMLKDQLRGNNFIIFLYFHIFFNRNRISNSTSKPQKFQRHKKTFFKRSFKRTATNTMQNSIGKKITI